ncbi:PHP domain-containing protein [Chloroflexota bacterium]
MTLPHYKKVDMHIHTPESYCYSESSISPEQIVESALAAGLDAIAITDHNSFRNVHDIEMIASDKGLAVFPGSEISTKCGHFLALFQPGTPEKELEDFLDYIKISRIKWGDASFIVEYETVEILEKIVERRGLAIAAHIERWPSGFVEGRQPRRVKMDIHSSLFLSALEITIPGNKRVWNNGEMRDYPKKYPCIQGSDAHHPDEIGRRPVYIRMDGFNLDDLRAAFKEPDLNISFPGEIDPVEM